ncbi:MAG: VWA domain-containing protein [Acidobacteriota bacterium]
MTHLKLPAVVCLLFLLSASHLLAIRLFAQDAKKDQESVVKLKTELINVRAVVTDKNGNIIENLTKEDFEVLENDRPQQISFFSLERTGKLSRAAASTGSDSIKNSQPTASKPGSSGGHTVVLFVDTVNLSFSSLYLLRQELKKFVATSLSEDDQVALVTTTASLGIYEQFTRDRQLLNRLIDKIAPWQPDTRVRFYTPLLAARVLASDRAAKVLALCIVREEQGRPCGQEFEEIDPFIYQMSSADEVAITGRAKEVLMEGIRRRQMTLSTLRSVTERLQGMPGQKILALFSDGFTMMGYGGEADLSAVQTVVSRAVRSGVVFYAFNAKGLQPDVFGDASVGTFMPPPSFSTYMGMSARDSENGLNALAADTGGKALFNTNNLNIGLQQALDENSIYYALDYYSSNTEAENKFRKIKVRVKNHDDYKVRAQRGYLPADFKNEEETLTPRQQLIKAMTAPLSVNALGVAATADFIELEGDKAQVSLSIYADPVSFDFLMQNDARLFDAELGVAVLNTSGKVIKTINEQMKGQITPAQFELAKRNGFKSARRLELEPGTYNIRIGLLETHTQRVGSTSLWVEVPDLKKGNLTLSDLLLITAQPQPTNQTEVLQKVSRQGEIIYSSTDVLSYGFKIYNAPEVANLRMQVEFAQDNKVILQTPWTDIASVMDDRDAKAINVSQQFKLNNLKPGTYQLKVRVQDTRKKYIGEKQKWFVIAS